MKTKTICNYFLLFTALLFAGNSLNAQKEEEIRIKVLKKIHGKTQVIDTIISMPHDSVLAFWTTPHLKNLNLKPDSITVEVQKQLKKIKMMNRFIVWMISKKNLVKLIRIELKNIKRNR